MKRALYKIDILTLELIGFLILHLGEIVMRFPCNHTGALFFQYRDCILALALFEIIYSVRKKTICVIFWLLFLFALGIPFVEDKFNILLLYDTWIERGIPEWGTYQGK
jgi:hypothetical protein